ncbi:14676_t:CDS:2 [Acaulospora colombiana]|uniref:14676_t:CDS:1 n=1 Tax=Acaulospora colombiana TaxID=27376 RepID=A0ACA9KCZ9_9GLOM|nr:14676_t:CDS:2 [Acaulospora colombiana]
MKITLDLFEIKIELDVKPHQTVTELKGLILSKLQIVPSQQELFLGGTRLFGDHRLSDYQIEEGSIVRLVLRVDPTSEFQIFVNDLNGSSQSFLVSLDDSVLKLKKKISEERHIEAGNIRLIHCGKELENDRKLEDYKIREVRAVWSQNPSSTVLKITCGTLLTGGFFIVIEALYLLLADWTKLLLRSEKKLRTYELYALNFVKLSTPVFSIIGAMGEVLILDSSAKNNVSLGESLRQFSVIGFLVVVGLHFIFVTYFVKNYGNGVSLQKHLRALLLYISAALILVELVFRAIVFFSKVKDVINSSEWVYYIFEAIPELVFLVIFGGVILGEWFYAVDDDAESQAVSNMKSCRKCDVTKSEIMITNKMT